MTDFTDEDVRQVAKMLWEMGVSSSHVVCEARALDILAAVLPEYAKRVRAEELREAADEGKTDDELFALMPGEAGRRDEINRHSRDCADSHYGPCWEADQ
jgi:hypothetical protein